jgi:DivIVA domain-containing protein
MIELTPLDVRTKRGDFAKALRGYEAQEVDVFLELVAERMEVLVKENLQLKERSERLGDQVKGQEGREHAVQEALVTAQTLRQEVKDQTEREAQLLEREAQGRIEQMLQEAEKLLDERTAALEELERHRTRFLKAFRTLLERELDAVEVEASRKPLEDVTLDIELGRGSWSADEAVGDESEVAVDDGETPEAPLSDDAADVAEEVSAHVPEEVDGGSSEPEGPPAEDLPEDFEATVEDDRVDDESVDGDVAAETESSLWLSSILKRDQQESE